MGKKKSKTKVKKSCCGKYLKKSKYCSKCPAQIKEACKLKTEEKAAKKKGKKKKMAKK